MAPQRAVLKFFLTFSYEEELTVSFNKFSWKDNSFTRRENYERF